ncbi:MAG: hypothetical protein ABII00_01230 [Elusimicrobiota bacterium]
MKTKQEEVGDLFVTQSILTIKLMPSRKSASKPIHWFVNGVVADHRTASKDISSLVGRVQGKSRIVRGLTLMTDRGTEEDIHQTGLPQVVTRAGFTCIN